LLFEYSEQNKFINNYWRWLFSSVLLFCAALELPRRYMQKV